MTNKKFCNKDYKEQYSYVCTWIWRYRISKNGLSYYNTVLIKNSMIICYLLQHAYINRKLTELHLESISDRIEIDIDISIMHKKIFSKTITQQQNNLCSRKYNTRNSIFI